jgi:nitrate reductase NapE component
MRADRAELPTYARERLRRRWRGFELLAFVGLWLVVLAVQVAWAGALVYIVWHFIAKYW